MDSDYLNGNLANAKEPVPDVFVIFDYFSVNHLSYSTFIRLSRYSSAQYLYSNPYCYFPTII
jgi:hypothetical protein